MAKCHVTRKHNVAVPQMVEQSANNVKVKFQILASKHSELCTLPLLLVVWDERIS